MNRYEVEFTVWCGPDVPIPDVMRKTYEAENEDELLEMLYKRSPHMIVISIRNEE